MMKLTVCSSFLRVRVTWSLKTQLATLGTHPACYLEPCGTFTCVNSGPLTLSPRTHFSLFLGWSEHLSNL